MSRRFRFLSAAALCALAALVSLSGCATTSPKKPTETATETSTFTHTPTFTPTWSYSNTPTNTRTHTNTPSDTLTPTNTFTPSNTFTASNTFTPSNTFTACPTGIGLGFLVTAGGYGSNTTSHVGTAYNNGDIGNWVAGGALPSGVSYMGMGAAAVGGYVYTAGGDSGANAISTTYAATVGAGGTISSWATSAAMPGVSSLPAYTNNAGTLYVAGGWSDFNFTSTFSTVYAGNYTGGAFSGWVSAPPLPAAVGQGALAYSNGFLFQAGGLDSSAAYSSVYRATASGTTVGAWSSVPSPLPGTLFDAAGFGVPNRIFVVGGNAGTAAVSTIYSATVDGSGNLGAWTTSATSLPVAKGAFSFAFLPTSFSGYVYVIGGWVTGTTVVSTVYSAWFSCGTLGAWSANTAFPININDQAVAF